MKLNNLISKHFCDKKQNAIAMAKRILESIASTKRGYHLLCAVNKSGALNLKIVGGTVLKHGGPACWVSNNRMIYLSEDNTPDEMLRGILFELANAHQDAKLRAVREHAKQGLLCREGFVQSIEFIEYNSAKIYSHIAEEGIARLGWAVSINNYGKLLKGPWKTFHGFLQTQEDAGHADLYRQEWKRKFKEAFQTRQGAAH